MAGALSPESVALEMWLPNTRVQRTRSSPSARHSPLTRRTLGNAWRNRGRWTVSAWVGFTIVVPLLGSDRAADPCAGAVLGMSFSANMLQVSQATSALSLLKGQEDPKLKRLLEYELLSAIAAARKDIEGGAEMPSASVATVVPNLRNAIEKARSYVVRGGLDAKPPGSVDGIERKPLENLEVITLWLSSLQKHAKGR